MIPFSFTLSNSILSKSNKRLKDQPYPHFGRVQSPLPRLYPRPMQVLGFKDRQTLGLTFCSQHSWLYHNINIGQVHLRNLGII